jgi:phage tail sheath gpL-like
MAQDILSNGFVRLCIDPSLNFFDGACKVLIIGQGLSTEDGCTLVPDVIQRVNNERDLNCQFGQGSILTEALRTAFCQCSENLELYALPLADPAAGVAAVYTSTITGPATSDGRFTLFLGNDIYSIDIPVTAGDTVDEIAAAVVAAVPDDFPYTAAVVPTTGVTFTAKNKGTVGNFLNPVYNWAGRRNYAPAGVTVSTVLTTPGTGDPVMPDLLTAVGECCYSCWAYLGSDTGNQTIMRDAVRDAWSCDKPQCFGHGYVYNSGSLGTVLATADNSAELSRVAYSPDAYEFPWQVVANYAALSCCTACDNPELSVQGPENGVLSCIRIPTSCTSPWTFSERQQLADAGFVTYGPSGNGTGQLTNPQIYNDITNYMYDDLGRANATFRDTNSRRLAAATALAIAEHLQQYNGLALFTKNTKVRQGVRGTNPRLVLADLRAWAQENVGVLFSEFDDIDRDITVKTDFEVAEQCRGNPNLLWVNMVYRQPLRIGQINTNLQPKLLDNCDR